jgi:2-C-methyl-D-erythritol 2,4-cyclodiphosphate synthase
MNFRIGQGFDAHAFGHKRKLVLGGVEIPHPKGLAGYSDADALLHAICDALLGAIGAGDIGQHFPDTDPKFKDVSSLVFLKRVADMVRDAGFHIVHIDATIVAQEPRMAPFIPEMVSKISECLQLSSAVNIKATTTEKMGFTGRGEGIAALAVATVAMNT